MSHVAVRTHVDVAGAGSEPVVGMKTAVLVEIPVPVAAAITVADS